MPSKSAAGESRTVTRLRMWLRALGETAPYTPVLLVGTHAADLPQHQAANGGVGSDIWREVCEVLLEPARQEHTRSYAMLNNCVLCSPVVVSELRQSYAVNCGGNSSSSSSNTWAGHSASKLKHSSTAGFVDLSRQTDRFNPVGFLLLAMSSVHYIIFNALSNLVAGARCYAVPSHVQCLFV